MSGVGRDKREVYSFDMINNMWSECGKLVTRRQGHCMCVCDDIVFVFGGRVPGSFDILVRSVEMLVNETSEWRVSGQLSGSWCINTVCCDLNSSKILVFGVRGDQYRATLQMYDTSLNMVTHILTTPSAVCSVYGVVVTGNHVIMLDINNAYTVPVSSVYKSHSNDIRIASSYQTQNTGCAVFCTEDHNNLILVGGVPAEGN